MSHVTYEMIQPLIAEANQDNHAMKVTFRCPVTGQTVEARAHLQEANTVANRATQSAKRSVMWSLRNALGRTIRQAFGYGSIAGRVASDAAYSATSGAARSRSFSESDKRDAIVRAFQSVSNQFAWDAQNNRYISAQAAGQVLTDFMQQMSSAPVTAPYDRGVLARVLTEIACADGSVGDDERQFLAGFITPDIGTVDSLAQKSQLSAAELAETSQGPARDTMLMFAWALAMTDEDLSPQEAARLEEVATGLGITPERNGQLRQYSQVYLLDQALGRAYPDGRRDEQAHAQVMAFAAKLGLDATEAERVDIRFRKRYGLV